MDRYARRQHFERLVGLRETYGRLDGLDTMSVISIDDAIAWAIDLLERTEATIPADGVTDGREVRD
jgi:hypothetical protein